MRSIYPAGGALTGRGGDLIIIDDPHKPDEAQSDVRRNNVLDWYGSTLLSRCNDPVNTPIILIQQRLHENDLAGMLLEQGGWEHLNLQAIAEESETFDLGRRGLFHRKKGICYTQIGFHVTYSTVTNRSLAPMFMRHSTNSVRHRWKVAS